MTITPEWIQAIAAVATLAAAIVAVVIANKAPRLAALFADQYRRESAVEDERQRTKTMVFLALMKGRRQLLAADTIAALNMIDIVFVDAPAVRAAWRDFVAASNEDPFEGVKLVERYSAILSSMAQHMGHATLLSPEDLRLGYYPRALGRIDEAALADAEEKIARRDAASIRQERIV